MSAEQNRVPLDDSKPSTTGRAENGSPSLINPSAKSTDCSPAPTEGLRNTASDVNIGARAVDAGARTRESDAVPTPSGIRPTRPSSRWRSVATHGVFFVLGALLTSLFGEPVNWWVNRGLDQTFPADRPRLDWAVTSRPATEGEYERLELLRAVPKPLVLLRIHCRNEGPRSVPKLTFQIQSSSPFIAHAIPIHGTNAVDEGGRRVTDAFRHFAYRKQASITLADLPPHASLDMGFFFKDEPLAYGVLCLVDDEPWPIGSWPSTVDPNENMLATISFHRLHETEP